MKDSAELMRKVCDSCGLLSGCTMGPYESCAVKRIEELEKIARLIQKIGNGDAGIGTFSKAIELVDEYFVMED